MILIGSGQVVQVGREWEIQTRVKHTGNGHIQQSLTSDIQEVYHPNFLFFFVMRWLWCSTLITLISVEDCQAHTALNFLVVLCSLISQVFLTQHLLITIIIFVYFIRWLSILQKLKMVYKFRISSYFSSKVSIKTWRTMRSCETVIPYLCNYFKTIHAGCYFYFQECFNDKFSKLTLKFSSGFHLSCTWAWVPFCIEQKLHWLSRT